MATAAEIRYARGGGSARYQVQAFLEQARQAFRPGEPTEQRRERLLSWAQMLPPLYRSEAQTHILTLGSEVQDQEHVLAILSATLSSLRLSFWRNADWGDLGGGILLFIAALSGGLIVVGNWIALL
jgi:hypothetical protein